MHCIKSLLLFFSLVLFHQPDVQSAFDDDLLFEFELDEPVKSVLPIKESSILRAPKETKKALDPVGIEDFSICVDCIDFVFWISPDFTRISMRHHAHPLKMVFVVLQMREQQNLQQLKNYYHLDVIKVFTQDIRNSLNSLLARAGYKIALCG